MATLGRRKRSSKWIVRYVDLDGVRKQRSTGTTDKRVAQRVQRKIESDLTYRNAGMIDDIAIAINKASRLPLENHVQEYLEACDLSGQASRRIQGKRNHLLTAFAAMKAKTLSQISADALREWMKDLARKGLSPATVNEYRTSLNAFLNWCKKDRRVAMNNVKHVPPVSTREDKRRNRRALKDSEVERLLNVAEEQDIVNNGREWASRRAVYVVALFTGLRKTELRSLLWGDIDLELKTLKVREEISKSRREDDLPLHEEVVDILSLLDQGHPNENVFVSIPTIKTFKRDCERAGICLVDNKGRTVDFHSLRATFCTRMIRAGVPASHVQRLMRHADIKTTNSHYTDLQLHDLSSAVNTVQLASKASQELEDLIFQVGDGLPTTDQDRCHQKCHHNTYDSMQSDASSCNQRDTHGLLIKKHKPRIDTGLCDAMHDDASKRVRRFERPTFTLAT